MYRNYDEEIKTLRHFTQRHQYSSEYKHHEAQHEKTPKYMVHPKLEVTSTKWSHHATFILIKSYNMHTMLSFPFSWIPSLGVNP